MLTLKSVLSVQTTSGGDGFMRKFIFDYIKSIPNIKILQHNHNIYITKGKASLFPCVVAHLDTVHPIYDDFNILEKDGVFYAYSRKKQVGTGGDDKCGIYVALRALSEFDNIKVAFFHDEELGCVGSSDAHMKWFDDVTMAMQADRRGSSDIIFEAAGNTLASDEFIAMIKPLYKKYGFHPAFGSITDVQALKDNGLRVSCFNISAGYHEPHSSLETVVEAELMNTYNFMKLVLQKYGNKLHTHYEAPAKKRYGGYNDGAYVGRYDNEAFWADYDRRYLPKVVEETTYEDPYGFIADKDTVTVFLIDGDVVYDLTSPGDEDNFMLDYPEYFDMIQKGTFEHFKQ